MSLFCETKTPIKFVLNLSMRLENDIRLTETQRFQRLEVCNFFTHFALLLPNSG